MLPGNVRQITQVESFFISAQNVWELFAKKPPNGKIYIGQFDGMFMLPDHFGHPMEVKKVFIYAQTFWALWKYLHACKKNWAIWGNKFSPS